MTVILDQFIHTLVESGLMTAEEVRSFIDGLPADQRPADGEALAKLLFQRKKLTKFQTQAIYQGKIKGLRVGNYLVLDKIGQGGMGHVYKAQHKRMKRVVALKVLPSAMTKTPEAVQRFQREVEAVARLEHTNIVTAHDADEADGVHFLVMQYVKGSDLGQLVRKKGTLAVAKALDYMIQAGRGLQYAHAKGVIHRDIKPSNLLLDRSGTIKILDMGLARLEQETGPDDTTAGAALTQSGQVMGTIDYMPPEQSMDSRKADQRADIYSLGCTLFYLLTGRPVYQGDTLAKKILAHREDPIPSLRAFRPDVPEGLGAVFQKMLSKRPEDRHGTMSAVLTDLEACRAAIEDGIDETITLSSEASEIDTSNSRHEATVQQTGDEDSALENWLNQELPSGPTHFVSKPRKRRQLTKQQMVLGAVTASLGFLVLAVGLVLALQSSDQEDVALDVTEEPPAASAGGEEPIRKPVAAKPDKSDQDAGKVAANAPRDDAVATVTGADSTENWALEFKGNPDHVEIPSLRYDGSHPITIEAYATTGGWGGYESVVSDSDTGGLWLSSFEGCWTADSRAENKEWSKSEWPKIDNSPTHLSFVHESKQCRFYVNGKLVKSATIGGPFHPSVSSFVIGAEPHFGPFQSFFHGIIDEVRFSNIARYKEDFVPEQRFEPDEHTMALYHFDEGSGEVLHDASGNGHHGKIVGATWRERTDEGDSKWVVPLPPPGILSNPKRLAGVGPWNVVTRIPVRFVECWNLCWHPDGELIAFADRGDSIVRIYDAMSYRLVGVVSTYKPTIVAADRQGHWLASGGRDGVVRLWKWDGTPGPIGQRHKSEVWCLAWCPDGETLASGPQWSDDTIRVWRPNDGYSLVLPNPGLTESLAWSPDGSSLASGGSDGVIRIWNPNDGAKIAEYAKVQGYIKGLAWSPDRKQLVSTHHDPGNKDPKNVDLRTWDVASRKSIASGDIAGSWLNRLDWHPRSGLLAASQSGYVCLLDAASASQIAQSLQSRAVFQGHWSPDGTRIADTSPNFFGL